MRQLRGILSFTLAVGLTGCLREKVDPTVPVDRASVGRVFKVGFAQANSPWRQVQNASIVAADARFPNIQVEILDAGRDSSRQITQIDTFLTNKFDLLLVSAIDAEPLTPKVGETFDKGIPVILMERGINSDKFTTLIGGDNVQIGRMAGEFLSKQRGGNGTYVEIKGVADATLTRDRSAGFHEIVDKAAGWRLAESYVCNYKRDEAIKYIKNLIQKKTPFDAIYAHNDEMALGAMIAIKNAGIDPKTKIIIGIDGVQEEAIRAIIAGEMTATFKYPWLGDEALQAAHDILSGKTVEKKVTPATEEVTKENAQAYLYKLPKS